MDHWLSELNSFIQHTTPIWMMVKLGWRGTRQAIIQWKEPNSISLLHQAAVFVLKQARLLHPCVSALEISVTTNHLLHMAMWETLAQHILGFQNLGRQYHHDPLCSCILICLFCWGHLLPGDKHLQHTEKVTLDGCCMSCAISSESDVSSIWQRTQLCQEHSSRALLQHHVLQQDPWNPEQRSSTHLTHISWEISWWLSRESTSRKKK